MVIEWRFLRNLRTLLLLVILLGTVQYLLGSYVLNQTGRDKPRASAPVGVNAAVRQAASMLKDNIPAPASSSQLEFESASEMPSRVKIKNSSETLAVIAKVKDEANFAQILHNDQIEKVTEDTKLVIKENKTILCEALPPGLGPFDVNISAISLLEVEELYPEVSQGGHYKPPYCTAIHKVAVIVPYRDRIYHLGIFLNNIHRFLMRQQIEYRIFVMEQQGEAPFNRGKLLNVGYVESRKLEYHCYIFHDVDLLPKDTRNIYSCPRQPRHMAPINDDSNRTEYFGGVGAMTEQQFIKVNGFSNKYWNWGGEDDDMTIRLRVNNLQMARYIPTVNQYLALNHSKARPNPKRFEILRDTHKNYRTDGLTSLQYKLVSTNENHLYTHFMIDLSERPMNIKTTSFLEEKMGLDVTRS